MLLTKAIFFYKLLTRNYIFQLTMYEHKGVNDLSILTARIFLPLVLQNNYSLNPPYFRRL